jgi:hypothetical protein
MFVLVAIRVFHSILEFWWDIFGDQCSVVTLTLLLSFNVRRALTTFGGDLENKVFAFLGAGF